MKNEKEGENNGREYDSTGFSYCFIFLLCNIL